MRKLNSVTCGIQSGGVSGVIPDVPWPLTIVICEFAEKLPVILWSICDNLQNFVERG